MEVERRIMNLKERRERFRAVLAGDRCVHPASVFDPISARIADDLGFEVGIFSGSIASAMVLGAPDLVVLTLTEFADQIRRICRASSISLLVGADHGYGNALNVKRTVEELETAGVAALNISDTLLPASFGKAKGQELISLEEAVGKMKAALAARQDPSLVIGGFIGVPPGHMRPSMQPPGQPPGVRNAGLPETIRRAKAYERAGVDALFLAGASTREEVAAVHAAVKIPLQLHGDRGELTDEEFLAANGVRITHQGHLPFEAAVKAVHDTLKALRDGVSPTALRPRLASPDLLGQATRQADYNRWISEYLN